MSTRSNLLPERSGVYRSPPDAAAVQAQAVADGAFGAAADFDAISSKHELLDSLAVALALTASFGRNWDALADALQDLPVPEKGCVLHLKPDSGLPKALGHDWLTLLEILSDAASYWQERGRAFVVLIDGAAELPLWR